jgi:hypothetical protein
MQANVPISNSSIDDAGVAAAIVFIVRLLC